jgi:hypothetical protein
MKPYVNGKITESYQQVVNIPAASRKHKPRYLSSRIFKKKNKKKEAETQKGVGVSAKKAQTGFAHSPNH